LVHESVPDDDNEDNNEVVHKWGMELVKTQAELKYHHHELLHMIGGYEPERGRKVAGHKGYFLTGNGMLLNMALYNFGIQF